MSDKVNHVSATSIAAFKACPIRYRLAYVEAIRVAEEPQPLRMGTAWHKGLEVLETPTGLALSDHGNPLSVATSFDPLPVVTDENRLELAVMLATAVYTTIPDYADPTEWAVEREIVANAIAAYHWLYGSGSEYETVATELPFDLPLVNPETGRPTPNFRRVGKIDRIIRHKGTGAILIQEYKSTSKPIDSGSTYWDRLRKDTQSKFYIVAARDLQVQAVKPENAELPSIGRWWEPGQPLISGLLHDVFHKPGISPKKLTQAESAEFVKTGEYCGQEFSVVGTTVNRGDVVVPLMLVDDLTAEVEPGKKEGTFALRETPGMFGARLLQDMTTRPEFYFARREVPFTDAELKAFEYQVWALQRNMNEMERTGFWFENEQQCEATFRCAYTPICYNNQNVCDGVTVPPGFKRLRVEDAEQTPEAGE